MDNNKERGLPQKARICRKNSQLSTTGNERKILRSNKSEIQNQCSVSIPQAQKPSAQDSSVEKKGSKRKRVYKRKGNSTAVKEKTVVINEQLAAESIQVEEKDIGLDKRFVQLELHEKRLKLGENHDKIILGLYGDSTVASNQAVREILNILKPGFCKALGKSGARSRRLLNEFETHMKDQNVNTLVIFLGGNDFSPIKKDPIPAEESIQNFKNLIDRAISHGTLLRIVVVALCRRKDTPDDLTDKLNREIKFFCTSKCISFLEWGCDRIIDNNCCDPVESNVSKCCNSDDYHPTKSNMLGMIQQIFILVGYKYYQTYADFDGEIIQSLKESQGLVK